MCAYDLYSARDGLFVVLRMLLSQRQLLCEEYLERLILTLILRKSLVIGTPSGVEWPWWGTGSIRILYRGKVGTDWA